MTAKVTAFVLNTNIIQLTGLTSETSGTYLNSATVSVTVKDTTGTQVSGQTWPLSMTYVTLSNGNYTASLSSNIAFVANQKYVAFIDADATSAGVEKIGHWEMPFTAKTRTS